jgi:hypothetical protein
MTNTNQEVIPTIKLTLTVEEVNTILSSLDEMPHKMVRGLVDKISKEGQEQLDREQNEATEEGGPEE